MEDDEDEDEAESRPTRGAWIETDMSVLKSYSIWVAPHTGRVD